MAENDGSAITRCPECSTTFRVTASQLQVAEGKVRCGACLQVFEANLHLLDGIAPVATDAAAGLPPDDTQNPTLIQRFHATTELSPAGSAPGTVNESQFSAEASGADESPIADGSVEDQASGLQSGVIEADDPDDEAAAQWDSAGDVDVDVDVEGDSASLELDLEADETGITGDLLDAIRQMPVAGNPDSAAVDSESDADIEAEFWAMFEQYMQEQQQTADIPAPDYDNLLHIEGHSLPDGLDVATQLPDDVLAPVDIEAPRPGNSVGVSWYAASLVLVAALALQFVWQQRFTYSQDERFREYYDLACRYAGCVVPDFYDSEQLETTNLVIRSHPDIDQALVVDAVIRNLAENRQPFPALKLSFTDQNNRVVASRHFLKEEYLAGEMRGMSYIPGRTEVRFSLEIHDPGENALGYTLLVVPPT